MIPIILTLLLIPFASAEEFEYTHWDDKKYVFSYDVVNGHVNDLQLTPFDSIIFNATGNDATLILTVPKSIPVDHVDYQGGRYNTILVNERETLAETVITECFFEHTIPFNGPNTIEVIYGHVIAGPRTAYMELPTSCMNDERNNNDIQQELKEKKCRDESLYRAINLRDEVICVTADTFSKMYSRDYVAALVISS